MMRHTKATRAIVRWVFGLGLIVAPGCDSGDDQEPLGAPSDLKASIVDGGVHLTWKDNSSNEAHFMVFRRLKSDADFGDSIAEPAANSTSYHDASVESKASYVYMIHAMDAGGAESPHSNEVEITVP